MVNTTLPSELLLHTFTFLSHRKLIQIQTVNKQWRNVANHDSLWQLPNIGIRSKQALINKMQQFELAGCIRKYILDGKCTNEQLTTLFTLLSLKQDEREKQFPHLEFRSSGLYRPLACTSDEAMIVLALGLMTEQQICNYYIAINNKLITALLEEIITLNQFEEAYRKSNDAVLILLENRNKGLEALTEKLISLEEACCFKDKRNGKYLENDLDTLLSHNGIQALREKLITPKQVLYLNIKDLKILLSDKGLKALREGLITPEQAAQINALNSLLSDNGLKVLREKLITPEQAALFYHKYMGKFCAFLSWLLTENGLTALREKLITPEQAAQIRELNTLLSDNGVKALREKLITPEQAAEFYDVPVEGRQGINLSILLTDSGMQALRAQLITPEQAVYHKNLYQFLADKGLNARQSFSLKY